MTTKPLLRKSVLRILLLIVYTMLGSWMFHCVEKTPITYKEMSANMLEKLHYKYQVAMNHSEFTAFVNDAYEAVKVGRKVEWTFLNTTSYVFTILTTIGKSYPKSL